MSEFGMQAAPHVNTLRRFLPPDRLWPLNGLWTYHYHVPDKMIPYLKDFGDPRWLHEYVFLTQIVQGEALKTAIEHCRRRKFACGGALYWSLNAPWPNACWETVDYYGRPKAGFYFAKRAFAPIIVSPARSGDSVEVYLVNDTPNEVKGVLTVRVVDVSEGKVAREERMTASAPPNASTAVARLPLSELVRDPQREVLHFTFEHPGGTVWNTLLLAKPREVSFAGVDLSVEVKSARREGRDAVVEVEVSSGGYARYVYVDVVEDFVAIADDSYFDLLPGERKLVKLKVKGAAGPLTIVAGAWNARPVRKSVAPQ
jgi:beta-mannosidase